MNEPAQIRFRDDGMVEVLVATQTNGQGHDTTFAQLVHEHLGVPFNSITIRQGDSADGLSGAGTVGSRSLQTAGSALKRAMDQVIERGKAATRHVLQAGSAGITFRIQEGGGQFRSCRYGSRQSHSGNWFRCCARTRSPDSKMVWMQPAHLKVRQHSRTVAISAKSKSIPKPALFRFPATRG